jgi:23S rRNA pseudouridine1911/1915/1917 synthase
MPATRSSGGGEFTFHVLPLDAGVRLDRFIPSRITTCSRSYCAHLIASGMVQVAGQDAKPSYRVKAGDVVSVRMPPPIQPHARPEPVDLDILYQDAHILVLNKQPGLVVHPAPGHAGGTLVNGLLFHCPDLEGIGGELRPGIVHRLDKDTSGTLVVAKTAEAHLSLSRQFKARTVRKVYLALVRGRVAQDAGSVDLPIGRHPTDRKRMSTRSRKGRSALTAWEVKERFEAATLLEIRLRTGRTHQIRVHCAAIGHPVVGDPLYGGRRAGPGKAAAVRRLSECRRQMLHAWRLTFAHPATGRTVTFASSLPADMENLLSLLRQG